ncbi:short chain dehydrogenase [Paraphaeosphaeria sporulosa]|uniref:Short chain dehydrogenase n=1 Tax=Paraphaeosphaeria sporulosa TaxID=1460663 RepID=A0A177CVA4_9PLEO|nr:short chain dehydrogenase [Paraphaeosphaeria sporulosa]OAG11151.1 short chain dehydrogenase [Paraphaeosphaeria sporulosa]
MIERLSLKGRTTVITGGGRGIGLAIAEAAAEAGSNIAVLDVLDKPHKSISKLGVKGKYYRVDVTKMDDLERAFGEIGDEFGRVDGCVPAAGIAVDKPFLDHTWDECERLLRVNVLGAFFSSQLAARAMRAQGTGGSIVLIASMASHHAVPLQHLSMYGSTKGAVRIMMTQMAAELAPWNIRVNSISPGFIRTDMTLLCARQQPELFKLMGNAPPLGRIGETSDIVGAVNYLLSDAAAYTTGADIPIAGGMTCGRIAS